MYNILILNRKYTCEYYKKNENHDKLKQYCQHIFLILPYNRYI